MRRNVDLLHGSITKALSFLAIPIMATSLLQMTYSLVDMLWIGLLGSNALAAVGAASMFSILILGLAVMCKMGGQVKLGHALGQYNIKYAQLVCENSINLGIFLSVLFGILCAVFARPLVQFFNFSDPSVVLDAQWYTVITCGLCIFSFLNTIFTGLVTAMGNSKLTLQTSAIGLVLNLILDPLFIFGYGPIPGLRVAGAALATVLAQAVVTGLFIYSLYDEPTIFSHLRIGPFFNKQCCKEIVKIGYPAALDNAFYSIISMIIARFIAQYGDAAIAVQKVGAQIESITWMVAQGFGMALNSFVAQNYGAKQYDRINQGYRVSIGLMSAWGIFTTILLYFGAEVIMAFFVHEADVLVIGVNYLHILAFCQIAMTLEYCAAGVFNGLGQTLIPSATSVVLTAARVPVALVFMAWFGLDGIWWTLTVTSLLKTTVLYILYMIKHPLASLQAQA